MMEHIRAQCLALASICAGWRAFCAAWGLDDAARDWSLACDYWRAMAEKAEGME